MILHRLESYYRRIRGEDKVVVDFEVNKGFALYAKKCALTSKLPTTKPDQQGIHKLGARLVTVFSPAEAKKIKEDFLRVGEKVSVQNFRANLDYGEFYNLYDQPTILPVFKRIFGTLDQELLTYFNSYYFVYSWNLVETFPATNPPARSFLWHCDKGPLRHLKILLYLNGFDEHQGNTEFISKQNTVDLGKKANYRFRKTDMRLLDIDSVAAQHKIALDKKSWKINAGQAIIFEPAQVLHRGILPSLNSRYLLSCILLPSDKPWPNIFEKMCLNKQGGYHPEVWPQHARDLGALLAT